MPGQRSALLALPEAMIHEIHSWSPTSLAAATLQYACQSLHRLRCDPAAAALLLLRCPCRDYAEALTSFGDYPAAASALVQNLLSYLRPSSGGGGSATHTAPEPLLSAMLLWASRAGETATVRALLSLAVPPDLEVHGDTAMRLALEYGPPTSRLSITQALLDSGVRPWATSYLGAFCAASLVPDSLTALQLLLRRCPAAHLAAAQQLALGTASMWGNTPAAAELLPATHASDGEIECCYWLSVSKELVGVLALLLDHHPVSLWERGSLLAAAASYTSPLCAALLLDSGAAVNFGLRPPLCAAIYIPSGQRKLVSDEARLKFVALLLRRGAVVTATMVKDAQEAGSAAVVELLQAALAAGPGGLSL